MNNYRAMSKKVEIRRRRVKVNKDKFYAEFSSVTEEEEAIAQMCLDELRGKLQSGQLSAEQVIRAYLAKAVEADRLTNAVTEFLDDALSRAKMLDKMEASERGPLFGIPISLKVTNVTHEI